MRGGLLTEEDFPRFSDGARAPVQAFLDTHPEVGPGGVNGNFL